MKNEFIKKLEALKIKRSGQHYKGQEHCKGLTPKGQYNEAIDTCIKVFLDHFGNSEPEIESELDKQAVIYLKLLNEMNDVSTCWGNR